MSWDDVRLLSPERKAEVDGLAAAAMEQQAAAAAARERAEEEAQQQAIRDAEAQVQLIQMDRELAVGTRIAFRSLNTNNELHGQYTRFKRKRTGANEHHIDFGGSEHMTIKPLRLKKIVARWLVAPTASLMHDCTEDGTALATLVAELKPGAKLI